MVHLRLAEWDELPAIADIGTAAFAEDPIYLHFNPWRSVYPDDWRNSFLYTLQWRFAEPGSIVLVAELELEDGKKVLAGYLTATRRGADNKPLSSWLQQPSEWGIQIATPAQRDEAQSNSLLSNLSTDADAISYFYSEATKILGGSKASTLETQTIAVLPEYQRHGIGKLFSKWSFDMAETEGIPTVGDASKKGINLYLKIGLKVQGTIIMEARTAKLEGTQVEVEMPRLEVPVIKWTPGDFRAI